MSSSRTPHLSHWLGAIALLAFVTGCADESGTVVDVDDDSITVADNDTQEQTTYRVSPEADVTRDGDPASLLQVQPGDDVDITLGAEEGDNVASDIDATSTDDSDVTDDTTTDDDLIEDDSDLIDDDTDVGVEGPIITPPVVDAEPMALEGSVAAIHEESIMVQIETEDAEDNEVEVIVDDGTEITLDGVAAEFGDILPGYTVFVSADEVDGRLHGNRIEATSTDTTPPPVTDPDAEGIDEDPERIDEDPDDEAIDPDGVPGEEPEPIPEPPAPQP